MSTTLQSGTVEFAAMAGAAATSRDGYAFGVANQLELAASFRDCYAGFLGWTRVPEFAGGAGPSTRQRYEVLHMGLQRQLYNFTSIPRVDVMPYAIGGLAYHNADLVSRGVQNFNENFAWQTALAYGAGVRIFRVASPRWGLRLEYRAFRPLASDFDFGTHHSFSAGIAIRTSH